MGRVAFFFFPLRRMGVTRTPTEIGRAAWDGMGIETLGMGMARLRRARSESKLLSDTRKLMRPRLMGECSLNLEWHDEDESTAPRGPVPTLSSWTNHQQHSSHPFMPCHHHHPHRVRSQDKQTMRRRLKTAGMTPSLSPSLGPDAIDDSSRKPEQPVLQTIRNTAAPSLPLRTRLAWSVNQCLPYQGLG